MVVHGSCSSNVCPCMPLQKGSMILAVVDAVISMMNLGLMIITLIFYIKYDNNDPDLTRSERTVGIVVVIIMTIICILQVLLAFRLYNGAKNRDYRNCRLWIIITTVITTINIINFILNFSASDFRGTSFIGTLFVILYKPYEIAVVYQFLKEMKRNDQGLGFGNTITAYPHQLPQQFYPPVVGGQQHVYVVPTSQEAYPMQQYATSYPPVTVTNQNYPAPVHHVTSSRIL